MGDWLHVIAGARAPAHWQSIPEWRDRMRADPLLVALARGRFETRAGAVVPEAQSPVARATSDEAVMAQILGLAGPAHWRGAAAYAGGGPPLPAGAWLVRPVALHAALDHVTMAAIEPVRSAESATQALIDELNEVLDDAGWRLHAVTASHWVLEPVAPRDPPDWIAASPRSALGRNIDAYLPDGRDARRWRQLATSIEMAWFDSAANRIRIDRGVPALSSLWLSGPVPARIEARALIIVGDAAEAIGAAGIVHAERLALSTLEGAAARPDVLTGGEVVVFDEELVEARHADQPAQWLTAWTRVAQRVGAALLLRPDATIVLCGDSSCYRIRTTRRGGWRFWQRGVDPLVLVTESA